MAKVCANCGATMVQGTFPDKYVCPVCDKTEPKKKTPEVRAAAGKKAAETKRKNRDEGKGGKK